MSSPENHEHDQIADYILGGLPPEETAALQRQLAEDPTLAQEAVAFQKVLSLLPYALPARQPSSQLKSSLLASADSATPPTASVPSLRRQSGQRQGVSFLPWLAGSAAAVAIAALGLNSYYQQRASQTIQQLEAARAEIARLEAELVQRTAVLASIGQPDTLIYPLEGAGPAAGAAGRIVATTGQTAPGRLIIMTQSLPPLSEEQVYRLWAIADADSTPQYCGQFAPRETNGASAIHEVTPAITCKAQPEQIVITLDGANDPITSAGPLVMFSPV